MQVMRFVSSAYLPFKVVENPEFQNIYDVLRVSHCPLPTRKKISTELLPGLHEETKISTSLWEGGHHGDGWLVQRPA